MSTITGFVPDEIMAKMSDTLRAALALVSVAADVPNGINAVAAKHWNVSCIESTWDDFKKSKPSSGAAYGGHLLLSHMSLPGNEMAPPAWDGRVSIRLRTACPAQRSTGNISDLAAISYPAACRRKIIETVIANRRWGYNNVYRSLISNWSKVEDNDPGLVVMDNTALVQFTFTVTPIG